MLIIKGDKNIVTVTRVYIASPEGANGRNVVAYGMLNALTSKYKTMVFRPAVSNHDEFTPILLAASNAGLGVALSTGLDVHKVREDKDTARGDIVGAFNDAMDVSRADAALIVGTDKSHVNDPTSYEFDANVAADLKAGVFLAVCTIDRWPHELDETVKLSIEGMEAAGNKVLGIFVTGCEPRHAFSVKETLAKYGLPVWTLPQVPFTDESTKDLALETFRKNAPTDEVLAALDVDVTAPITPYAFQFGLLGKAKSNKKTIVLPEGEEDRIIKAADYLLEREIVNLIIVGNKDAILARGKELGLNYLERARFQAMDDENVLKPMVAKLCELRAKKGKTDEQTFENWIKACQQLKKDIDIPETILDWLLEAHPEKTAEEWETEFLAAVDQMSEWAFHDACTGCNPVYPTIAELKGCYLKAFYGEKKYAEKYGDIWEVPVTLPTDTHAAYPMGLCADLGVEKTGGFN